MRAREHFVTLIEISMLLLLSRVNPGLTSLQWIKSFTNLLSAIYGSFYSLKSDN